jgi:signal transduction histidine kinase
MKARANILIGDDDEAALRDLSERLAWVLETTGIGLWLNEVPLGTLNWDKRTRDLFFVPDGVEPTIELFWSRLHPDDREPTRLAVEAALRDRTLYVIDHRAVNPASGQVRWIRSAGKATYGPDGRPVRFDGINYDISERKRTEEALRQAEARLGRHARDLEEIVRARTAKLSEMVAELQHVSYAIAHDMRAPLRAMGGFAQVLIEGMRAGLDPAEAEHCCRRIVTGANRLDRLILDALNYTKAVLLQVPLEPIALAPLLRGLVETYPNLHPDKADIAIPAELPDVLGDGSLLTQCFSNLLGNAVKFVPPGARPRIRVWAEMAPPPVQEPPKPPAGYQPLSARASSSPAFPASSGAPPRLQTNSPQAEVAAPGSNGGPRPMVRVWVEDNGIGIPLEMRERLFGMFQKLDNQYEGTGVGLAIVRKVVERMGGRVGVESEPGKGSRFWVELLEGSAKPGLTASPAAEEESSRSPTPLGGNR